MATPQKKALTDRGLKALKPAPQPTADKDGKVKAHRYIVWDAIQPYFGVSVTDKRTISFIVVKRLPGRPNPYKHVLGKYPALSLKAARARVPGILAQLAEGKTPREEEKAREIEEARKRADTFAAGVEMFVSHEQGRDLRTWRETEAILRREFLGQEPKRSRRTVERDNGVKVQEWVTEWVDGKKPIWRNRPVIDITRRDAVERLDQIKARNKYAARHALSAIRKFFNWAEEGERFGVEESPVVRIRDKTIGVTGKDLKRKRVLTDDELRDVWGAAGALGYPFGPVVQLLMLNGQRLNDVARAQRQEITNDVLVVPPERYKTGIAQEVPITPRAATIIASLPKFDGMYLFSTSGGARPISGISKMKERLETAIAVRRHECGASPMPSWVLHDLRRTVRTRLMSEVGVDAFIAERVIGHAMHGLHSVYDQGTHRDQKRAALQRWEALLLSIVEPQAAAPNVVPADEVAQRRGARRSI